MLRLRAMSIEKQRLIRLIASQEAARAGGAHAEHLASAGAGDSGVIPGAASFRDARHHCRFEPSHSPCCFSETSHNEIRFLPNAARVYIACCKRHVTMACPCRCARRVRDAGCGMVDWGTPDSRHTWQREPHSRRSWCVVNHKRCVVNHN